MYVSAKSSALEYSRVMVFLCTDNTIVPVNAALSSLFTTLPFHSSSLLNSCSTPDLDRATAYCASALLIKFETNARRNSWASNYKLLLASMLARCCNNQTFVRTCMIPSLYFSKPPTVVLVKVWCQWWRTCTPPTVLWVQHTAEFTSIINRRIPVQLSGLQCSKWLENTLFAEMRKRGDHRPALLKQAGLEDSTAILEIQ